MKNKKDISDYTALFNLGFRPFFLGALIFSIISISLWMAIYVFHRKIPLEMLSNFQWHAHEMIYGYSLAVIAGFLLTAVKNWTGIQTIYGLPLMALFSLWLVARILFLFGTTYIYIAGIFDLLFVLLLIIVTAYPVIQTKSWRHLVILSKVLFIAASNVCFYLGVLGILKHGIYWGVYAGLYLGISLIMMLGGKLIPFFIERGVGYSVELYDPKWIKIFNILLFIGFLIVEVFLPNELISGSLAAGLFIINAIRLIGWHTPGIWKKPLLWGLYMSFIFIDIGFLLFALSAITGLPKLLAIHSLAYGGIGLITTSMISRVSLGHTGRDVNHPPTTVSYAFLLLIAGTFVRVGLPIINMQNYVTWILISQILWIGAFLLLLITYAPILAKSRIDGEFG